MKILTYGAAYLRYLLQAHGGRELFAIVKRIGRQSEDSAAAIAEGVYWFCVEWYDGQRDPLYSAMCSNPFRPGCLACGPEDDTAAILYEELSDKARQLFGGKP